MSTLPDTIPEVCPELGIGHAWHQSTTPPPMAEFVAGSWGPKDAGSLLQQDGNQWRRL